MASENGLSQVFEITGKDFNRAGTISTKIKEILQEIGIDPSIIRRAAIAAYEAEMNIVMYADRGKVMLTLTPTVVRLDIDDEGPGIADIELAMQEGFSTATDEMREMGFGAGMGLPNIKRNSDEFDISSTPGEGTSIDVVLHLDQVGQ
jgi:anti-sigma regulatory factor (Ser/Thr protein kinase)